MRQCFISVDVEEDLVGDVLKRIGDDNVVISTDCSHAELALAGGGESLYVCGKCRAIREDSVGQLRSTLRRSLMDSLRGGASKL